MIFYIVLWPSIICRSRQVDIYAVLVVRHRLSEFQLKFEVLLLVHLPGVPRKEIHYGVGVF